MNDSTKPQLGQIVKILRGRDSNQFAVIIQILDQRFVQIADGDKKKFDQPKKKNLLHLELTDDISAEIVNSLQESGRVTNGKLRFALNRFATGIQIEVQQKGE